jgi:hypothetical protein
VGILARIFGRADREMIVSPGVVVLRRKELAEALRRPDKPNFSDDTPPPCDQCGKPLAELFITTGGERGDPELWRDHPVAVDGWACVACGVFSYPRRISPSRITQLATEGVEHGPRRPVRRRRAVLRPHGVGLAGVCRRPPQLRRGDPRPAASCAAR